MKFIYLILSFLLIFSFCTRNDKTFNFKSSNPPKDSSNPQQIIKNKSGNTESLNNSNKLSFLNYSIEEFISKGAYLIVITRVDSSDLSKLLKKAKETKNLKLFASNFNKIEIYSLIDSKTTVYFESSRFTPDEIKEYSDYCQSNNIQNIYLIIDKRTKDLTKYIIPKLKIRINAQLTFNEIISLIEKSKEYKTQLEIFCSEYSSEQIEIFLLMGIKVILNSSVSDLDLEKLSKIGGKNITIYSNNINFDSLKKYLGNGNKIIINNVLKNCRSYDISSLLKELHYKADNIYILSNNFYPPELAIFMLNGANVVFTKNDNQLSIKDFLENTNDSNY